jgi:hypothetical protein
VTIEQQSRAARARHVEKIRRACVALSMHLYTTSENIVVLSPDQESSSMFQHTFGAMFPELQEISRGRVEWKVGP